MPYTKINKPSGEIDIWKVLTFNFGNQEYKVTLAIKINVHQIIQEDVKGQNLENQEMQYQERRSGRDDH